MNTAERRAAYLLLLFTALEGGYLVAIFWSRASHFPRYFGFESGSSSNARGWILAAVVAAAFVTWSALRLPSVRDNLLRPSTLKALVVPFSVVVALLEEAVFRKTVMDALANHAYGDGVQVLASAVAFGLAHGLWGLFGRSLRAAVAAMLATGAMGGALAVVYVLADRSLAPCVAAHFLIDLLIEPGLMLAAARGEMHRGTTRR